MVSNDMAETLTNSTSPPPLDSNGLDHISNCYFDIYRDFYYKTPTKMGSKGLQQFNLFFQIFMLQSKDSWTLLNLVCPFLFFYDM